MLKHLILTLSFLISTHTFAQNYSSLRAQAKDAAQEKNHAKALELYRQAFAFEESNRSDLYNAACSASLAGNINQAFTWLKKALQLGYINLDHLKEDVDLVNLHTDAR